MVEAQQVQDGGVQVVDVDLVLDGVPAEVVGGSESHAALDAAAGQPHRKPERVMFPAVVALARRRPAEFAAPQDQRVIQQAARLEVGEQGGDRLIDGGAVAWADAPSSRRDGPRRCSPAR